MSLDALLALEIILHSLCIFLQMLKAALIKETAMVREESIQKQNDKPHLLPGNFS